MWFISLLLGGRLILSHGHQTISHQTQPLAKRVAQLREPQLLREQQQPTFQNTSRNALRQNTTQFGLKSVEDPCYAADSISSNAKCQECPSGNNGFDGCAAPYTSFEDSDDPAAEPTSCFPSLDACCAYADNKAVGCPMFDVGTTPDVYLYNDVNVEYISVPDVSPSAEVDTYRCATHFVPGGLLDPENDMNCYMGVASLYGCQTYGSTNELCLHSKWFLWVAQSADGNEGKCYRYSDEWINGTVNSDYDYPSAAPWDYCHTVGMDDPSFCDDPNRGCLVCKGTRRCWVPMGSAFFGPVAHEGGSEGCSDVGAMTPKQLICELADDHRLPTTPAPSTTPGNDNGGGGGGNDGSDNNDNWLAGIIITCVAVGLALLVAVGILLFQCYRKDRIASRDQSFESL